MICYLLLLADPPRFAIVVIKDSLPSSRGVDDDVCTLVGGLDREKDEVYSSRMDADDKRREARMIELVAA